MKYKKTIIIFLLSILLMHCSIIKASSDNMFVNLQIDAEKNNLTGFINIMDELEKRNIDSATIFATAKSSNEHSNVLDKYYKKGYEIGLHGYNNGEKLSSMIYEEQYKLLIRANEALKGCPECGTGRTLISFRPQYFSQNEYTFDIIKNLGFINNSGFKDHKKRGPYRLEEYNLNVVPISTVNHEDKKLYLCDVSMALGNKISGSDWKKILIKAYENYEKNNKPLILIFHGWYTGNNEKHTDYWNAFVSFLDFLEDKNINFVTTASLSKKCLVE